MRIQENNSHSYIYMILTAHNDLSINIQRGKSQTIHDRAAPLTSRNSKNALNILN